MSPRTSLRRLARVDDVGVVLVPLQQPVLEAAEAEEVVLLLELDDLAAPRAVVLDVVGADVLLVRHGVPAAVGVELDVAGVVAGLQQLRDRGVVAGLGGADEAGRSVMSSSAPGVAVALDGAIGPLLRGHAVGLGGLLHLEPVLVGAGEEEDVLARAGGASGRWRRR